MLFTDHDIAQELAAQLGKTDLGVTEAEEYHAPLGFKEVHHHVIARLDNGQEFLLTVSRWGGPR